MNILHVDDDPNVLTASERYFQLSVAQGYPNNGLSLRVNGDEEPDQIADSIIGTRAIFVILDHAMGRSTGTEVAKSLHKKGQVMPRHLFIKGEKPKGCAISLLSGEIPARDREEVVDMFRSGIFTSIRVGKPYDKELLRIYQRKQEILKAIEKGKPIPLELLEVLKETSQRSLDAIGLQIKPQDFDDIWNGKPNPPQDPIIALTNQMLPHVLSPNTLQGDQTNQGNWLARLKKKLGISR